MTADTSPERVAELLLPAESMALTVALAQLDRGEPATPNIATVCVLALGRLTGRAALNETRDDRDGR